MFPLESLYGEANETELELGLLYKLKSSPTYIHFSYARQRKWPLLLEKLKKPPGHFMLA